MLEQQGMNEVLGLCKPEVKSGNAELVKHADSVPCLSNYKNSFKEYFANMSGFKKLGTNEKKTSSNLAEEK